MSTVGTPSSGDDPRAPAAADGATVAERLSARTTDLTRAERQLADVFMENYPISGVGPITTLAERAGVSTPTVARMARKLGFSGFPALQAALREEIADRMSNPIARRDQRGGGALQGHILERFAESAIRNAEQTLALIGPERFDACRALFCDLDRRIFIVGGRVTSTLATYFFRHLQIIRPQVAFLSSNVTAWPHDLLDLSAGDVLVAFDVRRYENSTLRLAEFSHERGADIVLFTDQWRSPIDRIATHCLTARIAAPSAWDSLITPLLLVEAMLAAVAADLWPDAKARIAEMETLFDRTQMFRKFT